MCGCVECGRGREEPDWEQGSRWGGGFGQARRPVMEVMEVGVHTHTQDVQVSLFTR